MPLKYLVLEFQHAYRAKKSLWLITNKRWRRIAKNIGHGTNDILQADWFAPISYRTNSQHLYSSTRRSWKNITQ